MKTTKKLGLLITVFVMAIILTGCGNKNVEGKLEDLMVKVYSDVKEDEKPMMLENKKVDKENAEYFLGDSKIEFKEALASESGIGSYVHSVVLVRTKENADVEKIKEEIRTKINPRKWICVGIERDEVVVKSKGDLIILIIESDEKIRTKLEKGFDNL